MPERLRQLLLTMGTRASFIRLLVVAFAIVVVFGILNPTVFLSGQNLQYVELASPEVGILSLAMALTMLTAGIDLSVVSIANLSGVVAALIMTNGHQPPGLAILAAIANTRTDSLVESGSSMSVALTEGFQIALLVGAGFAILGAIVALVLVDGREIEAEPTQGTVVPVTS